MVRLERSDDTFESYNVNNSRQITQEQWLYIGLDYYNGKQYSNALGAFEQAAQVDPNSIRTYYCIGLAKFMLGFYSEALAALDKAIKLQTNFVKAYTGKAIV